MAKLTEGNYLVSVIDMGYSCMLGITIYQKGYCIINPLVTISDVSQRFSIVNEDDSFFLCITVPTTRVGIKYRIIKL